MATATVPGTCGELLQGVIDGRPLLVTCPIDRWTQATAQVRSGAQAWHLPKGYAKAATALQKAQDAGVLKSERFGAIHFDSQLVRSKGMASSTADITAALAAAGAASVVRPTPEQIAYIAAAVEPTDGTMHDGVVLFDSLRGEVIQALGPPPPVAICGFDVGGSVDTLAFHAQRRLAPDSRAFQVAVDTLIRGFERQDPAQVAWAATQSALLHQRVLPKPGLESVWKRAAALGMLGVCVAHSGTVFGILADARMPERAMEHACALRRIVQEAMPGAAALGWVQLVSGGIRWEASYGAHGIWSNES